ncbi:hypothetical protein DM01DRAFT_1334475 [Hesseltinella vesiculosa]|uniref:C2H2-type domain-containing protein n=1 Tax=Hesseltinella vesiculosa TaxID=101127 RepID=A0A1X2GM26_9FUNG|nr:hypothetical protein DM01DRAFT_1334475 [Hesseltinella vesiculosa]
MATKKIFLDISCYLCVSSFQRKQKLRVHLQQRHNVCLNAAKQGAFSMPLPNSSFVDERKDADTVMYSCPSCVLYFESLEQLESHINNHHLQAPTIAESSNSNSASSDIPLQTADTSLSQEYRLLYAPPSDDNEFNASSPCSNVTEDYNPKRRAEYVLEVELAISESEKQLVRQEYRYDEVEPHDQVLSSNWLLNDYDISQACIQFQSSTRKLPMKPQALSDLRLL